MNIFKRVWVQLCTAWKGRTRVTPLEDASSAAGHPDAQHTLCMSSPGTGALQRLGVHNAGARTTAMITLWIGTLDSYPGPVF